MFKLGLKTNLYSIGVFAVGVILLSVVMFVSPMHRFMDIDGAYAIVNLLQIAGFAVISFAVTQLMWIIRESIKN